MHYIPEHRVGMGVPGGQEPCAARRAAVFTIQKGEDHAIPSGFLANGMTGYHPIIPAGLVLLPMLGWEFARRRDLLLVGANMEGKSKYIPDLALLAVPFRKIITSTTGFTAPFGKGNATPVECERSYTMYDKSIYH